MSVLAHFASLEKKMTRSESARPVKGCVLSVVLSLAGTAPCAADEIDAAHRFSWGENIGWMNWRDAGDPPGSEGVRVHATFLSGLIWGENAGWINVGNGAPVNGAQYANADSSDFGVNIDPNGDLSGFAWGENIGWIQFDTGAQGDQRARFDAAARRFRGYAWGENVGWINLDDAEHFVGTALPGTEEPLFRRGDVNADTVVNIADPIHSVGCLFLGSECTECADAGDSNDDGDYDIADPIHTLLWLFNSGRDPPAPGPFLCGDDLTGDDALPDCTYDSCF
jgi:hypothetical protein